MDVSQRCDLKINYCGTRTDIDALDEHMSTGSPCRNGAPRSRIACATAVTRSSATAAGAAAPRLGLSTYSVVRAECELAHNRSGAPVSDADRSR